MTSPIQVHGDDDAGGRDDVSATVAGSVAAATARYAELSRDTFGAGSTLGDLMDLPPVDSYSPPSPSSAGYSDPGDLPVIGG